MEAYVDDSGGNRIIHGYDFVSDATLGMDGDGGRDPDYYDPGDFDPLACPQQSGGGHSWHGSKVASILAANYSGFLGVAPRARVMMVRVLGRCKTGYASDVADGIVWAAGGHIEGLEEDMQSYRSPPPMVCLRMPDTHLQDQPRSRMRLP